MFLFYISNLDLLRTDFHPFLPTRGFTNFRGVSHLFYSIATPFLPWLPPPCLPWFPSPSSLISTPFYHLNLPCFPPLYSLIKTRSTFISNHFFLDFHPFLPWFRSPSSLISTPFYHTNLPCFPSLYSLIKPRSTLIFNHFFRGFHLFLP